MKDQTNKQITQWFNPDAPVMGRWSECPECGATTGEKHDVGCSGPAKVQHVCRTTQFGPCKYGEYLQLLRGLLLERKTNTYIARNDKLEVALFEC